MGSLEDLERELAAALRRFDEAAHHALALWRDDVGRDFHRTRLETLSAAAKEYERALREAIATVAEVERLR
jgi:hypothetical protein